jgi:hypothetical protein
VTSAALHRFGRDALLEAWPIVTGAAATLPELQIAGAVAAFESGYGTGTFRNRHVVTDETGFTTFDTPGDPISNTNNWGSVQCKGLPPCATDCFEATDSSPFKRTPSNPLGLYQACFKRPATAAEGAAIFIREITLRRPLSWAAMKRGDIDAFSKAMHDEHYYEGFGATVAEREANHAHAVEQGVREIAAAMNEPVVATRGGAAVSASGPGGVVVDLLAAAGVVTTAYYGGRAVARLVRRARG